MPKKEYICPQVYALNRYSDGAIITGERIQNTGGILGKYAGLSTNNLNQLNGQLQASLSTLQTSNIPNQLKSKLINQVQKSLIVTKRTKTNLKFVRKNLNKQATTLQQQQTLLRRSQSTIGNLAAAAGCQSQ